MALGPALIIWFQYNFTQWLDTTTSQKKLNFKLAGLKVKVVVAIFRTNFIIALALSLMVRFQYNFTQWFGMTISLTSSTFRLLSSRSRSQWLFLEKLCHCSSAFIYEWLSIWLHTMVGYYKIWDKFHFQPAWLKVKVIVSIFRKTLSLL